MSNGKKITLILSLTNAARNPRVIGYILTIHRPSKRMLSKCLTINSSQTSAVRGNRKSGNTVFPVGQTLTKTGNNVVNKFDNKLQILALLLNYC